MNEYWLDCDSVDALRAYLLHHESDISIGINDFGELKGIFYDLFDREPKADT